MNKKTKILILSAVALLVVVLVIVILRRRGRKAGYDSGYSSGDAVSSILRKKTYLKDRYRLNNAYTIWVVDDPEVSSDSDTYYQGVLEYVFVPAGAGQVTDSAGYVWTPINGVGLKLNGKSVKTNYDAIRYIESKYLSL